MLSSRGELRSQIVFLAMTHLGGKIFHPGGSYGRFLTGSTREVVRWRAEQMLGGTPRKASFTTLYIPLERNSIPNV